MILTNLINQMQFEITTKYDSSFNFKEIPIILEKIWLILHNMA